MDIAVLRHWCLSALFAIAWCCESVDAAEEIAQEAVVAIAKADFERSVGVGAVDVEAKRHVGFDLKSSFIGIRDGDPADYERLNRLAEKLKHRTIWRVQVYRTKPGPASSSERLWSTTYYIDARSGEILR